MLSSSFGSRNQGLEVGQNYGTISAEFHLPPERSETPPRPFATIPFYRDSDFVDRGDLLEQIHQRCSEPAGRVALVGLGGIGKSQLAIEYAYRVATEQADRWVFWVHAGTQARLEEGFRVIADAVKVPGRKQPGADILQLVSSWLSNGWNGRWMMILDSADDGDMFFKTGSGRESQQSLAGYLPQSQNGCILVTTRNRDLATRLTGSFKNVIEVGPMTQTDALLLLEKRLGSFSDDSSAEELVQALDRVPLAISQAGAYIQAYRPRTSIAKYLEKFRKSERVKAWLLGHDTGDLRRDGAASSTILVTWQMSFDSIRSKRPSAADILSLMSFFDRQGIPEWLLKPVKDSQAIDEGRPVSYEFEDSKSNNSVSGTEDFEDDISMLRDYCLITPNQDGDEFEMHELVQLSTRMWLKDCGRQEEFKEQFITRLSGSFPRGDYSGWAICRRLFAHVEKAIDYQPASSNTVEEAWATLLHNGGCYMWLQGRGDWKESEKLFVQVMETSKTKLGADHLDTLISMSELASTYRNQGRLDEAEKLFVQVLETSKTKLGADHPDTLISMDNLASTYRNQGRLDEAEKLGVKVMETRKTKLGTDHPDTLTSMGNLASTYWHQGRWDEAEKLEVQVMETRKTKLGADHPDTLTSISNLASTYRNQGRLDEAEKLGVQVMETRKTKLGADHPDTLSSMGNLASTYRNHGRLDEAEKLEVQVMETCKTKLGADHPDTLISIGNLALTYGNQGRLDEAEKLGVQVMETRKTKLGADHPDTLTSMANLAFTWKSQGRHKDALALMQDCVKAQQRVLGLKHPSTLSGLACISDWSS